MATHQQDFLLKHNEHDEEGELKTFVIHGF